MAETHVFTILPDMNVKVTELNHIISCGWPFGEDLFLGKTPLSSQKLCKILQLQLVLIDTSMSFKSIMIIMTCWY